MLSGTRVRDEGKPGAVDLLIRPGLVDRFLPTALGVRQICGEIKRRGHGEPPNNPRIRCSVDYSGGR